MTQQMTSFLVKAVAPTEGSCNSCHSCNGSRWRDSGGGINLAISDKSGGLLLELCRACADNLQAAINAQLGYLGKILSKK